ncbi:MAG: Jag N-terminal domain-containing protein, partial [Anaerolineales bacterium]
MDDKRTSLEMIAPTIEEAIAKGLEELNLPEEAVDIDILDIGSQGLFGLGSRQARVRLTVKDPDATP